MRAMRAIIDNTERVLRERLGFPRWLLDTKGPSEMIVKRSFMR